MSRIDLKSLFADGNELEEELNRYEATSEAPPVELLERLHAWLLACVAFGAFLPDPSPDRRHLQGRVDYWTSRLGSRVSDIDRLAPFEPGKGNPLTGDPPYPGLSPYDAQWRASFFGRGSLVAACVEHLADPIKRILLIVGASGSGKSSLALAGILPRLQAVHPEWLIAPRFTPGEQPIDALAASIAKAIGRPERAAELASRIASAPDAVLALLAEACPRPTVVLFVDQFEELFTLCRDTEKQKLFGEVLYALSEPESQVSGFMCRILLTLRTDHLARLENSTALHSLHGRLVSEHDIEYLSSIAFDDIKLAILEPAKRVGLRFVPATLVDQLASQTAGLANGLPLLQFALRRLWDTREKNADGEALDFINERMVRALPDVQHALGTVADELFGGFTLAQKQICDRLFQELVVLDENFEEPLRRRRSESELRRVLADRISGSSTDIDYVIAAFEGAELIRGFGGGEQRQIEVAHEALFRHWDHLNRLLTGQEVKERLHLVKQVGREAAEWVARGQLVGYLNLRGERLARALDYARDGWLEERESAGYLKAAQAVEEEAREKADRAAQAERAAEAAIVEKAKAETAVAEATAKKTRAQMIAAILAAVFVVMGLYWWSATSQQASQRKAALSAFATHSAALAPWEGLDVAFSLAPLIGPDSRYLLAHALDRMEGTSIVGSQRGVGLFPNTDGSALLQLVRSEGMQGLRIYPIVNGAVAQDGLTIPLTGRIDLLASARVGPPAVGSNDHLAILVFRLADGPGYKIELYRVPRQSDGGAYAKLDDPVRSSVVGQSELSEIAFDATGRRAVFASLSNDAEKIVSQLYMVTMPAVGPLEMSPIDDSAPSDAAPATAVAFGRADRLITGRLDGSIYCDKKPMRDATPVLASAPSPVRQIAGLSTSDLFAYVDRQGGLYAWGCSDADKKSAIETTGRVAGVTLTQMDEKHSAMSLLSFIDEEQPRCYELGTGRSPRWQNCDPVDRVGASVPLSSGAHLVVERGQLAVIRAYPMEAQALRNRAYTARRAGDTVVRWKLPSNPANGGRSAVDVPEGAASEGDIPWKSENGEWVAKPQGGTVIITAALSANGQQLAWIEQRQAPATTAGHGAALRMAPQNIAFAWKIGDAKSRQISSNDQQAIAVAIASDGSFAYGHATQGSPAHVNVNGKDIAGIEVDGYPCLAYSADSKAIVIAATGGRVWTYRSIGQKPTSGGGTGAASLNELQNPLATDASRIKITACDVGDSGTVVLGTSEGQVLMHLQSATWQDLTEVAAFRLASAVQDVLISGDSHYVTALAAWQLTSCGRPSLPGQSIQIWDTTLSREQRSTPISSVCLPNQLVLAVGEVRINSKGAPAVKLVAGSPADARSLECLACARTDETPSGVLERLVAKAKELKAVSLDPKTLETRYLLKTQ